MSCTFITHGHGDIGARYLGFFVKGGAVLRVAGGVLVSPRAAPPSPPYEPLAPALGEPGLGEPPCEGGLGGEGGADVRVALGELHEFGGGVEAGGRLQAGENGVVRIRADGFQPARGDTPVAAGLAVVVVWVEAVDDELLDLQGLLAGGGPAKDFAAELAVAVKGAGALKLRAAAAVAVLEVAGGVDAVVDHAVFQAGDLVDVVVPAAGAARRIELPGFHGDALLVLV